MTKNFKYFNGKHMGSFSTQLDLMCSEGKYDINSSPDFY